MAFFVRGGYFGNKRSSYHLLNMNISLICCVIMLYSNFFILSPSLNKQAQLVTKGRVTTFHDISTIISEETNISGNTLFLSVIMCSRNELFNLLLIIGEMFERNCSVMFILIITPIICLLRLHAVQ